MTLSGALRADHQTLDYDEEARSLVSRAAPGDVVQGTASPI